MQLAIILKQRPIVRSSVSAQCCPIKNITAITNIHTITIIVSIHNNDDDDDDDVKCFFIEWCLTLCLYIYYTLLITH